jgi:hypothetical protein
MKKKGFKKHSHTLLGKNGADFESIVIKKNIPQLSNGHVNIHARPCILAKTVGSKIEKGGKKQESKEKSKRGVYPRRRGKTKRTHQHLNKKESQSQNATYACLASPSHAITAIKTIKEKESDEQDTENRHGRLEKENELVHSPVRSNSSTPLLRYNRRSLGVGALRSISIIFHAPGRDSRG